MSSKPAQYPRRRKIKLFYNSFSYAEWNAAVSSLSQIKVIALGSCSRNEAYLVHGVGEECLEGAALARGFVLEAGEKGGKRRRLLALGEHLQAVVVVAHVLLVDAQHGQQHVEEISWNKGRPSPAHEREGKQRATRQESANNNTRAQATQTKRF